jgi:hypothetical protein
LFIHGGGFDQGAASVPLYDSAQMVSQANVVVVTFNYRLGVLGFLASEGNGTHAGLTGNYAFKDQLLAMQWTKNNVKAFGGDPENIVCLFVMDLFFFSLFFLVKGLLFFRVIFLICDALFHSIYCPLVYPDWLVVHLVFDCIFLLN